MKMKNKLIDEHNKMFDYLDWFWFSSLDEIILAISDYYYPNAWDNWEQPSYWELSEYSEIAKDYSEYKQYDFDFDE